MSLITLWYKGLCRPDPTMSRGGVPHSLAHKVFTSQMLLDDKQQRCVTHTALQIRCGALCGRKRGGTVSHWTTTWWQKQNQFFICQTEGCMILKIPAAVCRLRDQLDQLLFTHFNISTWWKLQCEQTHFSFNLSLTGINQYYGSWPVSQWDGNEYKTPGKLLHPD